MTLGARLERDRLERRALRLEHVIGALRTLAHQRATRQGRVPPSLERSLSDFDRELATIRAQLARTPDTA